MHGVPLLMVVNGVVAYYQCLVYMIYYVVQLLLLMVAERSHEIISDTKMIQNPFNVN